MLNLEKNFTFISFLTVLNATTFSDFLFAIIVIISITHPTIIEAKIYECEKVAFGNHLKSVQDFLILLCYSLFTCFHTTFRLYKHSPLIFQLPPSSYQLLPIVSTQLSSIERGFYGLLNTICYPLRNQTPQLYRFEHSQGSHCYRIQFFFEFYTVSLFWFKL